MTESVTPGIISEEDRKHSNEDEDEEGSYHQIEKKKKSPYTRKEYILIIVTFTGQFFVNACVSLPAPFLPEIVSLNKISKLNTYLRYVVVH